MTALKQAALSLGTLLVAGLAFLLVRDHAVGLAVALGVGAIVVPMLWMLVSAMRPAMPDRTCPRCGKESLRLLTPGVRQGVRCPECGFADAEMYCVYLIDVDDALDEAPATSAPGGSRTG